MVRSSGGSRAEGTIPEAMIDDTASQAVTREENGTSIVHTVSGIGRRRTVADVTIPSVPSEPTKTPRRS
jgi:hypothetical protein